MNNQQPTDEELGAAVRHLFKDDQAHRMAMVTSMAEYRAVIEAAHKRLLVDVGPVASIYRNSVTGEFELLDYHAPEHPLGTHSDIYTAEQLAAARLRDQQRIAEPEAQIDGLLKARTAGIEAENHRIAVRNARIKELDAQLTMRRGKHYAGIQVWCGDLTFQEVQDEFQVRHEIDVGVSVQALCLRAAQHMTTAMKAVNGKEPE